jgi:hypothetical protein
MAHHKMASLLPFLHRSAVRFSSSPSDQQEDLHRTLKGIPLTSARESSKVMVLEELMTLVLRTKSIGQWPFTLIDRTLEYL